MTDWRSNLQAELTAIAAAQGFLFEAVRAAANVAGIPVREFRCHGGYAIAQLSQAIDSLENARRDGETLLAHGKADQ